MTDKIPTCAVCAKPFKPQRMGQRVCSYRCAAKVPKIERKAEKAKDRASKEAQKTLPTLIKEAQAAFNIWVRARDAGKPCICCGKPIEPNKPGGSADAGHFMSRGSSPALRFEPLNCHSQRKNCNRPGGTTRDAFRAGMVERIGEDAVAWLEGPHAPKKYSRDDMRAVRDSYKQKAKELAKQGESV